MNELIGYFTALFRYGWFRNALIVGVTVSLCAALLGVTLVLKRYSMIGDGLSHVGFGALSFAAALNLSPLWFSIPVVVLAAFLLLRLKEKIRNDAAIALLSASALAFGVTVTAWNRGASIGTDVSNYMFGSIMSLSGSDTIICMSVCGVVLLLFILCYHRIFAITFDETFARATGCSTGWTDTLVAILTALTVVVGMRMMGTLLISSLIIFPALSAMRCFRSFKAVTVAAAILSVLCFLIGILLTSVTSTPAGTAVVLADLLAYALCSLAGLLRRRIGK